MKQILTIGILIAILWYGFSYVRQEIHNPTIRNVAVDPDLTIDGQAVKNVFAFANATVLDGDSLRLTNENGEQFDLRLASIDAPEWQQPFGSDAKLRLQQLLGTQEIIAWQTDTDQYGRLIAFLFIEQPDGQLFEVNAQMIRDGYAWHYAQYSSSSVFQDLESNARASRIGLWSDTNMPIPPWDFRSQ